MLENLNSKGLVVFYTKAIAVLVFTIVEETYIYICT